MCPLVLLQKTLRFLRALVNLRYPTRRRCVAVLDYNGYNRSGLVILTLISVMPVK